MTDAIPEKVDLSKYIETRLMGERPHIRGRRLPVSFVAAAQHESGLSIAEIAQEYSITEAQVLAALLYYREHQPEIDAQDADEIRQWQATRNQHYKKPGGIAFAQLYDPEKDSGQIFWLP